MNDEPQQKYHLERSEINYWSGAGMWDAGLEAISLAPKPRPRFRRHNILFVRSTQRLSNSSLEHYKTLTNPHYDEKDMDMIVTPEYWPERNCIILTDQVKLSINCRVDEEWVPFLTGQKVKRQLSILYFNTRHIWATAWQNQQIRPVWSESSLSAWRKLGSLATHWAHSEDSDQTGRMPRLIWVFTGCTGTLLVLSCRGPHVNPVRCRTENFSIKN